MKPYLNNEGKKDIDKLNVGVDQLRHAIVRGDINSLSYILKNVGATGLRKLATETNNSCLKRMFLYLANIDEETGNQLKGLALCDPEKAAEIVCNLLNFKAGQFRTCLGNK